MRKRCWLVATATLSLVTVVHAQDVHVRISPSFKAIPISTNKFPTIQMALDHAPQPGRGGWLYLHIAPGTYRERVIVTQNRPRTVMLGMGAKPEDVVITASQNAKSAGGTFFTSTVEAYGSEFEADNVTFENTAGNTGQAVAITVRSDRAIFKRCRFLGDQDTLFADFGRQYYVNSYIEGGVDFIFGNATAVFDDDEIHIIRPGYLTAQSRTSPEQTTGYVFRRAKVTAADLAGKAFYLGRPWRDYSRVVFLSSWVPESLSPGGWSPWKKGESLGDAFYGERDLTGPGARVSTFLLGTHQLKSMEAAAFAPERFLKGSDGWKARAQAAKLP